MFFFFTIYSKKQVVWLRDFHFLFLNNCPFTINHTNHGDSWRTGTEHWRNPLAIIMANCWQINSSIYERKLDDNLAIDARWRPSIRCVRNGRCVQHRTRESTEAHLLSAGPTYTRPDPTALLNINKAASLPSKFKSEFIF